MIDFNQYRDTGFRSPEDIRLVQNELLRKHLRYCASRSPYYRRILGNHGVEPGEITPENLADIPPTGKEELERENDAFLAAAPAAIVDTVFSSGTTGRPTKIAYTEHDLRRLAYNEHQSLAGTGMESRDRVLLTCTMDRCFVAGLAYFLGARSIGACSIRNGHGTMESHLEIIRRVSPTVIIGVPSFLLKLGEYMRGAGVDPVQTSVRKLLCIGEPVRNKDMAPLPLGEGLKKLWNASLYSTYASSETVSTFCECTQENGGHLHPELAVAEVLDDRGRRVGPGCEGELVITPLGVEGMPLIRFRTGDISFLIGEPCGCGRNSLRIGPILARKKQMIKLKGTTLYPQAIALALEEIPAVAEHFLEVGTLTDLSDTVTIHVALSDPEWDSERVAGLLQSRLRVKPYVTVRPLEEIRRKVFSARYRKPMRFFDRRTP